MTELTRARERLEDFVLGCSDCPEDAQPEMLMKLRRLTDEVVMAARVTEGLPF